MHFIYNIHAFDGVYQRMYRKLSTLMSAFSSICLLSLWASSWSIRLRFNEPVPTNRGYIFHHLGSVCIDCAFALMIWPNYYGRIFLKWPFILLYFCKHKTGIYMLCILGIHFSPFISCDVSQAVLWCIFIVPRVFFRNVHLHFGVMSEWFPALLTIKVVDVCVQWQMFLQVFAVTESLPAVFTLVCIYPYVYAGMDPQIASWCKRLSTCVAFVLAALCL